MVLLMCFWNIFYLLLTVRSHLNCFFDWLIFIGICMQIRTLFSICRRFFYLVRRLNFLLLLQTSLLHHIFLIAGWFLPVLSILQNGFQLNYPLFLFLRPHNINLDPCKRNRIEIAGQQWKFAGSFQLIKERTGLVLLSRKYQIGNLEFLAIDLLQKFTSQLLPLRHHDDRLSPIFQQLSEDLENQLRSKSIVEDICAQQTIELRCSFAQIFQVDLAAVQTFDPVFLTIFGHIIDDFIAGVAHYHLLAISPLFQCDPGNPNACLEDHHIFPSKPIALQNGKSSQHDVRIPKTESLELMREEGDVGDHQFHFEGVVQKDFSVAQPEDDLLAVAG